MELVKKEMRKRTRKRRARMGYFLSIAMFTNDDDAIVEGARSEEEEGGEEEEE